MKDKLQEAMAHLHTIAESGGTAQQMRELAAKGIDRVEGISAGAQDETQAWPPGLLERVKAAEKRIRDNHGLMRVPADPTDPDLELAEIAALIECRKPPFWLRPATPAAAERAPVGDLRSALAGLLDYVDRTTCTHEETHRVGVIWTICDDCGRKWADDEGGFVPHQDAPAVAAARAALASAPVACDHQFHFFGDQKERRCNRCCVLESKASDPVAGEARCIGYIDYKGINAGHARAVLTTCYDEAGNSWADGTKLYAAPQASPAADGRDALNMQQRLDDLYVALEVCSAELFAQCGDQGRAMKYVEQARKALAAEQCARASQKQKDDVIVIYGDGFHNGYLKGRADGYDAAAKDVGLPDVLDAALNNLLHDNYERSYSGGKNREADVALIRAAIAAKATGEEQ